MAQVGLSRAQLPRQNRLHPEHAAGEILDHRQRARRRRDILHGILAVGHEQKIMLARHRQHMRQQLARIVADAGTHPHQ